MRKYYQLLLILISIASLSTLLMYRREYLKLRYVLEVLSYFGTPQGGNSDCLVFNETTVDNRKYRHMFTKPPPSWTKVGQHFVYSAFWENEGDKSHVRAVAIGPPSAFTNFECHVWFDQGDSFYSEMGKFGYSVKYANQDANNANKMKKHLNIYQLYCEPVVTSNVLGIPQALILIYREDNEKVKVIVPIHKNHETTDHHLKNMAVCVKADVAGVSKSGIIEFITYHYAVGVSDFIVYDNGLHNAFLLALQTLTEYKGIAHTISILNWNFPYSNNNNNFEVESLVMEMDCLARTSGKVGITAVLDWDEYVVTRHHRFVPSMLSDFSTSSRVPVEFELKMNICCTDLKDDKRADKLWPLVLRKTQCMPIDNKNQLIISFPKVGFEPSKQKIAASVGAVHVYRPCSGLRTITKYDTVMAKYLGDFMTSKLIKLWRSGSLNNLSQLV